jgi:GxxExxY protein
LKGRLKSNAEVAKVYAEDAEVDENAVGTAVLKAAITVHSALGPGLLETAYEHCPAHEREHAGVQVRRQILLPLRYRELTIDAGYRIDLLIEGKVVLELKAIETGLPVHSAQLLSYPRLGGYKLGYLLNFHVAQMRDGTKHVVNAL